MKVNILMGILITLGGLGYDTIFHNLVMKTIASGLFVALGLINLRGLKAASLHQNEKKRTVGFATVLVAGFGVCMVADIVLEIVFMYGALLFGIGHIFYFAAYCKVAPFQWKDLKWACISFPLAVGIIVFLPIFDFGDVIMELVCIVYALLISCMLSKAISNYLRLHDAVTLTFMVGSVMFFFSDFMLLFEQFSSAPNIVGSLCVNSYYPAQAVLGFGIYKAYKK